MQPSDLSLGVFLAVVTLAALVVTAINRGAGTRPRRAFRIAAFAVAPLCALLTIAAVVNIHGNYYASWGDLASQESGASEESGGSQETGGSQEPGAAPTAPATPTAQAVPPGKARDRSGRNFVQQPPRGSQRPQLKGAVAAAAAIAAKRPGRGAVAKIFLKGATTKLAFPGRMYLPAAYFDAATPNRRFPVIQFFVGFPGSNLDLAFDRLKLHDALDLAIATGKLPPTIVVIAQQYPNPHRDTECLDVRGGPPTETYLAVDVPKIVTDELRVLQDRAYWTTMGYSSGGYCALNLAIRHSQRYGNVITLGGNTKPNIDKDTGEIFGKNKALYDANNPQFTIRAGGHRALNLFMFSAKGDLGGAGGIALFAPLVTAPDRVTTLLIPKGGHNSTGWRWALPHAFAWLASAMPAVDGAA